MPKRVTPRTNKTKPGGKKNKSEGATRKKGSRSKRPSRVSCVACGDTGINSKGTRCVSCQRRKGQL